MPSEEVFVNIRSKIISDGAAEEVSESAKGILYDKEEYIYVRADIENDEGRASLHFKIGRDYLNYRRTGDTSAVMIFTEGAMREAVYNTPYGTLCFTIKTNRLIIDRQEDNCAITISLNYLLETNEETVSENHMTIEIIK